MGTQIQLGDTVLDVIQKDIKNVHLSVHPPTGRVRISAPSRMDMNTIRAFAISKLSWIRQQQEHLKEQERETPREYMERETHHVWGRRYLLQVIEKSAPPSIELQHTSMILRVRPCTDARRRHVIMQEWYRQQLKDAILPLRAHWEPIIGVLPEAVTVRRMKTLWGSCSHARRTIRINLELAKKPLECLDYIVVHELVHLLEPTHNTRFVTHMDRFMPSWRHHRNQLNRLPVPHEDWSY
ncbi:MAG: M48 family metallopeptidase [Lentisphaerae bacterium]|nr:M48 family metallopeptidase [Lentisphaerota bacterium]